MTIGATSKENDYSKRVNYFQSWHMGTTNKLLQTALQKQMHSSRQCEAAIVTYCHTVDENGLRFTKSFKKCSISNDLDGTEDDELWAEQYDKSNTDSDMYDDTQTDTTDVQ